MILPPLLVKSKMQYIHGYNTNEQQRLLSQSQVLAQYIFPHIDFTNQKHILEIGSGVGAQTILLLDKFPHLRVTGVELSEVQLNKARENLALFPQFADRYNLIQADAKDLGNLDTRDMDAVVFIWVLEHISQPEKVLAEIHRMMPKETIINITEVFNNSFFLYPFCPAVMNFWQKSIDFQYSIKGDPNIGARLGALLMDTGYRNIHITPCVKHLDKRFPEKRLAFLEYWKKLMHSFLDNMIQADYVTLSQWEHAVAEMDEIIQNPETVFYYNSMQATAVV
jgi:ubiquinone/menaquinone biosynthesis C-methylase UbiE